TFSNALFKSAKEWENEGINHHRANRYEEALTAYDQAIRLNPNFFYTYYYKGNTLRHLKRYEEALTAYDQSIRLNPNYADDAYYNKGNALREIKRYKEALTAYDQS